MPDFSMPLTNTQSAFATLRGNHVCFRVPDYEASKQWFIEKLDFRPVVEWPFADMQLGYLAPPNDDNSMIEVIGGGASAPGPQPLATDLVESLGGPGYHHFCFSVASVDDTLTELRRRGVTIVAEPFVLDDISRKLAFFTDPFGNLFELAEKL